MEMEKRQIFIGGVPTEIREDKITENLQELIGQLSGGKGLILEKNENGARVWFYCTPDGKHIFSVTDEPEIIEAHRVTLSYPEAMQGRIEEIREKKFWEEHKYW